MFYSSVQESFPPQNTISVLELPCTRLPLGLYSSYICHGWPRVVFDASLLRGWPDIINIPPRTLHATQWECSEIIYTSFCHQLKLRSHFLASLSPLLLLFLPPPPCCCCPVVVVAAAPATTAAAFSAAYCFCSCCFWFRRNCWQASQPLFAAALRPDPKLSWTYGR